MRREGPPPMSALAQAPRQAQGSALRHLSFWATLLQLGALVFYAVFVFLDIPNRKSSSWLSYFDYYSTRVVFAVIILLLLTLINRFVVWYHHRLARGGSRFLLHFGFLVHIPWISFSLGNCVLLLMDVWPNNTTFLFAQRIDALRIVACAQAAIGTAASLFFILALARLAPQYGEFESRENQTTFETMEGGGWSQVPTDEDDHAELIEQQNEMIRFLKEQKKNLTKQVAELTERLEAHDARINTAASTAERIRDAFAPQAKLREQRERDEAASQVQIKDTEIRNLRAELDEAKSELERLRNSGDEAEPLRLKVQQLQSELRRLKTDNQQLQDSVTKLQLKCDVEKEANAEAQALIDKLNFDLSNLRNRLK